MACKYVSECDLSKITLGLPFLISTGASSGSLGSAVMALECHLVEALATNGLFVNLAPFTNRDGVSQVRV
jgi:hypothetical protein